MARVLVTGGNRGIGLALVRAHLARGDAVLASCRQPGAELSASGATVVDGIELSDPAAIAKLLAALGDMPLERVMLNAGILEHEDLDALAARSGQASIRRQFEVNALAPLQLIASLRPHLSRGARVGVISSRMGSIADNGSGGYYGYRMSKAALNAGARSLAIDLAPQQVAVFILHPGFVQTGMTGGRGDSTPEQAASQLMARVDTLGLADSGTFWHANGAQLPW
jgi:NAD(P)-dependent dehydrogenase (short-subunit alcohol dehydrogenase family)